MRLAQIKKEFVETCLRSIHYGAKPEPNIMELDLLEQKGGQSPEARLLILQDMLYQLVLNAYLSQRKAEALSTVVPETHQAILTALKEDFNCNNSTLESWSAVFHRYLAIVPLSVEELSATANVVPQQFRRRINQGLKTLTQELRRMELQAQKDHQSSKNTLPLPDFTQLVGAEPYLERLTSIFQDATASQLVSIEGMGGIGKTALARAFVALPETRDKWKNILWISARQYFIEEDGQLTPLTEPASTLDDVTTRLVDLLGMGHLSSKPVANRLEAIRSALQMDSYLIVIDNLETMEEYKQLIPALAKHAGKSRFLITSRQSLGAFPYVQSIPLFELDYDSTRALLEAECLRRGCTKKLSDEDHRELYDLVGGIPLAIKLIASQIKLRPLEAILEGFRLAKGNINHVYRYLYWQTWQLLSDPARQLMLTFLPADPEGEDVLFLQMMSGQSEETFYETLRELDQFSLLETSGDAHTLCYRLHRLTVTFLQTDILRTWDQDA